MTAEHINVHWYYKEFPDHGTCGRTGVIEIYSHPTGKVIALFRFGIDIPREEALESAKFITKAHALVTKLKAVLQLAPIYEIDTESRGRTSFEVLKDTCLDDNDIENALDAGVRYGRSELAREIESLLEAWVPSQK